MILTGLLTFAGYSQVSNDYVKVMEEKILLAGKAVTAEEFQDCANAFERISLSEANEWHPLYYAVYCYINVVFETGDKEKADAILDRAQAFLEKAMEQSPDNHELYVLQGFLYQGRIQADPMGRGMQFSMKANESFGRAAAINPDNPRIYFLQAMNLLYTPEAFGGGAGVACPLFQKAIEKYATFIPAGRLDPAWGGAECEVIIKEHCQM